jgi:hypothetical protein
MYVRQRVVLDGWVGSPPHSLLSYIYTRTHTYNDDDKTGDHLGHYGPPLWGNPAHSLHVRCVLSFSGLSIEFKSFAIHIHKHMYMHVHPEQARPHTRTGPNQLKIGAHLTGLVWFLIVLFFPLACACGFTYICGGGGCVYVWVDVCIYYICVCFPFLTPSPCSPIHITST